MIEDLISNNFVDNVDKSIIRKVILVVKILISLSIVYTILELVEWYPYLSKNISANFNFSDFYNYRIVPWILLLNIMLNIISLFFYLKGNKLMYSSLQHNDPDLLNEGFRNCYISGLLTSIDFAVGIITILFRFILKL
jgi:hypothetical protein